MSLCFSFFQGNQVFACADSRVSVRSDEQSYHVSDKYKKIRQIGNKVIFISGNVVYDIELFKIIASGHTPKQIQQLAKDLYNRLLNHNFDDDVVINIFLMEDGKATYYQMNSKQGFVLNKQVPNEYQLYNVGQHSLRTLDYCRELRSTFPNMDITEIIFKSYEFVADESVGGFLHCFIISNEEIQRGIARIQDSKELIRWNGGRFPYEFKDFDKA